MRKPPALARAAIDRDADISAFGELCYELVEVAVGSVEGDVSQEQRSAGRVLAWVPGFVFLPRAGCVCDIHTAAFKELEVEHFECSVGGGLVFEFDVAESVCGFVSRMVMYLVKSVCGTKRKKEKG